MNEEFYFSRKAFKEVMRLQIAFMIMGGLFFLGSTQGTNWYIILLTLLYLGLIIFSTSQVLEGTDKPAVIITDEKISTRSMFVGKREIKSNQIISVKVSGGCINIRYKKENNKERTHTIKRIQTIENHERLAEILREQVKVA